MKILWIFSALIGFTLPAKLDRIYLPPPGSKFSGGSPGDIDVPLELPKETNPSSSLDNNFGRPEIAVGIDTVGSNISPEKYGDVTSTVPSLRGNFYSFPTTTTSNAFSQTTSYVPAVDSTIGPDISISSKYPFNNPITGDLIEKNLSFDHTSPNSLYNAVEEKQMLNGINNILENQLPDNKINSQVVEKLSDENVDYRNGDVNNILKINSHPDVLGIRGITSTPTQIDDSLINNYYNTYHRPSLSEPINEQDMILISSTPRPLENIYSKTPSQYVSTSPIGTSNIPYSYRRHPERIRAQDREAVILKHDNIITPDGYAYNFDTSNGIHADEKGIAINGVRAVGSYSYIGDDGQLYSVNYTADENGFRPHGTHLPTAPPIPDAILKVIKQAEIDKANGIYDDGSYDENKYGYQKYNPNKNIRFLNQYNKNRESTNLNRGKNNNQLPHYTRLDENLNKDNDTDKDTYKKKITTKTNLQSFIQNDLFYESVPENSDHYKSEHFVNIGHDHIDSSNNDYNKNVQNEIINSMPNLKDIEKEDRRMSIEFYDETGYHYSIPQNNYSLKVANKLINRFPDTPAYVEIPEMYKKIVENTPVRPFMKSYVPRNDDILVKHDGDDQSFDIPAKFHEEENVILINQNTNPFPTLAETNKVPDKPENTIIHSFNNQFKPDILPSGDQGYFYENANLNNGSYVPFMTSTEIGLSDITPTIPTAVPSRFNAIESSKDNNSRNLSKPSESSLYQNQSALLNPSLHQENYVGPLTHSNKLDNYGYNNNIDNDITDSGSRYNIPNTFGTNRNYIIDQSTAKTYSEDFSGPKQDQKYDPLTGYHY